MIRWLLASAGLLLGTDAAFAQDPAWAGYGGNPQHTAISPVASQPLQAIRWSTPVDLNPQYTGNGSLLIHYGSPAITAGNTVIVPVKTGASDGFRVEGRSGATGALLWTQTTDYSLPPHGWVPSYAPVIAPGNTLYYPGAGGTVYKRGNLDAAGAVTPTQLAFYGLDTYNTNAAAFNANVKINTPITSDAAGNVYFGYHVADPSLVGGIQSGIAKITPGGGASYVSAASLAPAGDPSPINGIAQNCAPAVTPDGSKVYVTVTTATGNGGSQTGNGYLVSLNTSNLTLANRVDLRDAKTPANRATIHNYSTAAPMIAPNGDVFYGVLETPFGSTYRGWMLHFDANLSATPVSAGGKFGWDATASVVPKTMVPSYTGTSPYLIFTKYNNYLGVGGGDGQNKIAILDPFDTMFDQQTQTTVMKEILTKVGPTQDGNGPGVREWCINTAAVDPATNSVLVNNEDGKLYRWDLTTNTLSEVITLTDGIGEAYTPTLIGPDGTVYAINNATLYAVGLPVPEPALGLTVAVVVLAIGARRRRAGGVSPPVRSFEGSGSHSASRHHLASSASPPVRSFEGSGSHPGETASP